MTLEELSQILNASIGKGLRITFSDGVAQTVEITSVDEEGFVHSGQMALTPMPFGRDSKTYRS